MTPTDRPSPRLFSALVIAALALAVVVTYEHARKLPFLLLDDTAYVVDNRFVREGLSWAGIRWAFVSFERSNWHPLTWISLMLDCQLFGIHPWGAHLVNVALHLANGVLLYMLLRRTTGAPGPSAVVALLFALHPAHVESVAWVVERKDVASTLFWFLTWIAYAAWVRTRRRRAYCGALALFVAGLLCKPMLVTLPATLLVLDFWPLRRREHGWGPVVEKLPFFALSAAASAMTILAQARGGAVSSLQQVPLGARLANASVAYVRYSLKLLWPHPLSIYYPLRTDWPAIEVAGSVALLAAVSIAVWRVRARWPFLLAGWLLFTGTLVPVIGLVQVGHQSMADRYTYVPSVGFFVLVVWGAFEALRVPLSSRRGAWLGAAAAAVVLTVASRASSEYLHEWDSSEKLFAHAIAVEPGFHQLAHLQMGISLLEDGKYREAGDHFEQVLRHAPDDRDAQLGLVEALEGAQAQSRGIAGSVGALSEALRQSPDRADLQAAAGALLMREGHAAQAVAHFRRAHELAPTDDSILNLANALAQTGDFDGARRVVQELGQRPSDGRVLRRMGDIFLRVGDPERATAYLKRAASLLPGDATVRHDLGVAYGQTGDYAACAEEFRTAIAIDPDRTSAYTNLALALAAQNEVREAEDVFHALDARAQVRAAANDWTRAIAMTKAAAQLARQLGMLDASRDLVARQVRWYDRATAQ